eukprot:1159225-Pelagomonas_calceolata.AAC.4
MESLWKPLLLTPEWRRHAEKDDLKRLFKQRPALQANWVACALQQRDQTTSLAVHAVQRELEAPGAGGGSRGGGSCLRWQLRMGEH